ncbi:MAG: ABC transporter ATP-binding protein [candidate division Zixibacteria bacterium RBG_16_50_21]|nr:MAG: ABC transporter ATP-binding protein [candidate division Zixibacteria bacterium RBG_16_50_21]
MFVIKLIIRNAFRHKLRTFLTILGLALAVMAFGLIRTFITAWYSGADAAAPDRLATRSAVSIIFPLPLAYKEQIEKIDGVEEVTYANWFGGIYVDPQNFFANFAVDPPTFFKIYPEYLVKPEYMEAFNRERNAAIVGTKLADRFSWKIGDQVNLIGTIYPGDWPFVIRGLYTGKDETIDETAFMFRWDYLDETMRQTMPGRAGQVGWYVIKISDPNRASEISDKIDSRFDNSLAETLTETEKAFQLSFVQMAGTIIAGLQIISGLIIGVILLVLANTMAMSARERIPEYAYLKTIGFRSFHLVGLVGGESLFIAGLGAVSGLIFLYLVSKPIAIAVATFFPVFKPQPVTLILAICAAAVVGVAAAIFPVTRAVRMKIIEGLRVVE